MDFIVQISINNSAHSRGAFMHLTHTNIIALLHSCVPIISLEEDAQEANVIKYLEST